jgi:hypothetical protein
MVRTLAACSLLALSASALADPLFPIGREWAGDAKLPRPYGVSVDIFTLDQPYGIDELQFTLPGVSLDDPSQIDVQNRIHFEDLKFDVWVFPFLNLFAFYGHVHARTFVDLSAAQAPIPLGTLPVRYSGGAYGGGLTLTYGGEHWFTSLTGTYEDTNLSGDFDSSVHSTTWQPRLGWVNGPWSVWAGAYYLDVSEHHHGVIAIPVLGTVPFDVRLSQQEDWSPAIGAHYSFNDAVEATLEIGGGNDRTTTLLNIGYRFD